MSPSGLQMCFIVLVSLFCFHKNFFLSLKKPCEAEIADNRLIGDELFSSFPDCYFLISCFRNRDSAGKIHNNVIKVLYFKKANHSMFGFKDKLTSQVGRPAVFQCTGLQCGDIKFVI